MNIFFRELKAYRKSTLIWAVSLSTLVLAFLMMFPAFTKDVATSQKILANFPPAIRSAFDISLQNFFTIYGFFAYLFTFVTLAGAVQAMNLGVGVLSKEDSGKTVDFLLTKPVSRVKVITSKLLAVVCLLAFTNIVFSSVALITAKIVSTAAFSSKIFLLISATLLLVQIFFLAFGILLSVIIPKIKSVVSVSLPTVFTFFFIGTLGSILGNDNFKYVSPFKFYDPNYIINHGAYETKFLVIEAVFVVVAIIASYVIYIKKDIRAVS
jgi:ABC-2 type transport system permease protein